jgi:hypothetical protein
VLVETERNPSTDNPISAALRSKILALEIGATITLGRGGDDDRLLHVAERVFSLSIILNPDLLEKEKKGENYIAYQ